jgi:hypothetical protein
MSYKVKLFHGDFLTGRSWRKDNTIFTKLPFTSNLVYAEDNMGDVLGPMLDLAKVDGQIKSELMVCKKHFFPSGLIPLFAAHGYWPRQTLPIQQLAFGGLASAECGINTRLREWPTWLALCPHGVGTCIQFYSFGSSICNIGGWDCSNCSSKSAHPSCSL